MIRVEEARANKVRNYQLQNELHQHRVGPLRSHTRETLLSYMYLRNFPYLAVETADSKILSLAGQKNIRRMCRKYGDVEMTVQEWMNGKNLLAGVAQSAERPGGLSPGKVVGSNPTSRTNHARVAQLCRAPGP